MTQPSFSVCALVRETPDILDRFARYYLDLGAERVRLFFDGEAHEAGAPDLPGVELTVCDPAFWQGRLGRQPSSMRETHDTVFRVAHDSATSDWQFFCDADEFLVSDMPVGDILARLPDDCEAVRVMNVEAVWGPGDDIGEAFGCTYFRLVLDKRRRRILRLLLPGRRWELFGREGFAGHFFGKHFLRRGTVVDRYDCHRSFRNEEMIGSWVYRYGIPFDRLFIAHFDAISEARWIEKWRRRVSAERPAAKLAPQRYAQIDAMKTAEAEGSSPVLFREIYGVTRYEAAVLRMAKVLIRGNVFSSKS